MRSVLRSLCVCELSRFVVGGWWLNSSGIYPYDRKV